MAILPLTTGQSVHLTYFHDGAIVNSLRLEVIGETTLNALATKRAPRWVNWNTCRAWIDGAYIGEFNKPQQRELPLEAPSNPTVF